RAGRGETKVVEHREGLDRETVELLQGGLGLREEAGEPGDALPERLLVPAEALADPGELADEAVDRGRPGGDRGQHAVGLVDPLLERGALPVQVSEYPARLG